jgi:hypothetical protein
MRKRLDTKPIVEDVRSSDMIRDLDLGSCRLFLVPEADGG